MYKETHNKLTFGIRLDFCSWDDGIVVVEVEGAGLWRSCSIAALLRATVRPEVVNVGTGQAVLPKLIASGATVMLIVALRGVALTPEKLLRGAVIISAAELCGVAVLPAVLLGVAALLQAVELE